MTFNSKEPNHMLRLSNGFFT
uniref:Uncharacterized protein n=1 Tax=Arundo donax TaxID=35708 RepID=A0A0A9BDI9_ARUDO